MSTDTDRRNQFGPYSSSPCMAAELGQAHLDAQVVGPRQAGNVAQWRRAERARLRAGRLALRPETRARIADAVAVHLDAVLATRVRDVEGKVVSGYWPIKGELDLRPWLTALHNRGVLIALPVVETPASPLIFRRWQPGMIMERGFWNIPVPPRHADEVAPTIALSPLVGWDAAGFRLGYGGGYFDRTLAALTPRPLTIGVGLQAARIATIHPQPHDIPMTAIVTEAGLQVAREETP